MSEKLLLNVTDIQYQLGLSRGRVYELMKDGTIPSVKIGKRRLVPVKALKEYVDGLDTSGGWE